MGGCKKDSKNIGEYIGGVQLNGRMEERWGLELYSVLPRRDVQTPVLWNMECGEDAVRVCVCCVCVCVTRT